MQRSIEAATDEMTFEMDPLLMKQAEEVLQQRAGRLYLYWLAVSTDKAKAWNEIIEEFDDLIVGSLRFVHHMLTSLSGSISTCPYLSIVRSVIS